MQFPKLFLFVFLLYFSSAGMGATSSLELKAGIGYDYLSQEFYQDSLIVGDSILDWSQKTEFLNDFKGFLNLTYNPRESNDFESSVLYEQSPDFYRFKGESFWIKETFDGKLDLRGEIELKRKFDDSDFFGDDYWRIYLRTKFTRTLNESLNLNAKLYGENVDFDSTSTLNYDHHRIGSRIAVEKRIGDFSYLDGAFFVNTRQVPYATENNYVSIGLESSFLGLFDWGDIDLYSRFEKKDYQLANDGNDFKLFSLENRNKIKLNEYFSLRPNLDFEYTVYMAEISDLDDYYILSLDFPINWENLNTRLSLGPAFESLVEFDQTSNIIDNSIQDTALEVSDDIYSDEYTELGLKAGFEYINASNTFISLESETGKRDYRTEDDIVTDHVFQRFDIIADFKLPGNLNLNLFFSSEWEWHENDENNSTLYLISSSLSRSF